MKAGTWHLAVNLASFRPPDLCPSMTSSLSAVTDGVSFCGFCCGQSTVVGHVGGRTDAPFNPVHGCVSICVREY